ncbi:3-isopropylmalate dehydratase small subunit [candidate division WOR-3 bacterium]|nr:3-isopropylmalate dehydratase small subunit [candidate division WOR-3 bacterium]
MTDRCSKKSTHSLITGKAYKFGDNINTDVIYPGKYLSITTDREEMAKHCFETVYPDFMKTASKGTIIIAGRNFGCGSSREQAATCLVYFGVAAVIAVSYARIFYRNAINVGLPVIVSPKTVDNSEHQDMLEVDLEAGIVQNIRTGERMEATKMPGFIMQIINGGGLIPYLRDKLGVKRT